MEIVNTLTYWMAISAIEAMVIGYLVYIILLNDRGEEDMQDAAMQTFFDLEPQTKADCLEHIKQCNEAIDLLKVKKSKAALQLEFLRAQ